MPPSASTSPLSLCDESMTLLGKVVALALVTTFMLLAALHVYWAYGGRWGAAVTVPVVDGRPAFRPGRASTLVVAILLVAAGAIIAVRSNTIPGQDAAPRLVHLGAWTLCAVFALRAVGNFKTFGFFKGTRDTAFARFDTRLFSPLCVAISLGCLLISLGP
jgi:hypothetical protein